MDRYLDGARYGPTYLRDERIAKTVINSLQRAVELRHYELRAFVLMANHLHVLLLPKIRPSQLLRALKGATAREANRILCRTGEPFWQGESYDHYVRDDLELARIVAYIEQNPVKAGLTERPEDYPWSSASIKMRSVGTSACATNGTSDA